MLLGCIGSDSYGKKISENLAAVNVSPLLETRNDRESSRCGVGIFLKERVLVPEIRASTMLSMDWVNKNMSEINKSEILLVEGYFVIEKFDIVQFLVNSFNQTNKSVAFTLSATFMIDNFYDKMLEISNKSDIIFCNEEEAYSFAKLRSEDMEEVAIAIHKILEPRDRILVITCGALPVCVTKFDYAKSKLNMTVKTEVPQLSEAQIVDTNGCGDCKKALVF
jgi:adenosine kinase